MRPVKAAFPGEAQVGDEWTSKAELGIGEHYEPGPAVGLFRETHARRRPIERLLEKANGMLEVEAAHVGAPDQGEVWDSRTTPPEPEDLRLPGLLGQTTDLDEEHRADDQGV
jgi:hypothetical protein